MSSFTSNLMVRSAFTALCLTACAAEEEQTPSDVSLRESTLLEIQVNGARVEFGEPEPGFSGVWVESAPGKNPLADPAVRGMSLAQKYEYWMQRPAPQVLRAADERSRAMAQADTAVGEQLEAQSVDLAPESAELSRKAVLTAEQFISRYCTVQPICHTFVTGTGEYERRTPRVAGGLNAVQGNIRLQIRLHKAVGGWRNVVVRDVLQGVDTWYEYGDRSNGVGRPTKVKVYEAEGDVYHWSLDWW